ncbi:sensor histidine kinase [Bacteroidota bacterium]
MKNNIKAIDEYMIGNKKKRNKTVKISFLSHISHGIRTPLNSIMGFSKLLGLRNLIDPKQKEYVQGILNGSNLLLQFVDNIMDLSQFELNNYSLRVGKYDLNKVLWEFSEDFYNQRIENNDTNINLMLVWDTKLNNTEIETDSILLKKALQRMINLVSVKYPTVEFELGYRKLNDSTLKLFIRPSKESLNQDHILEEAQLYTIDENNSFDYFNYKVLIESLSVLGGELSMESENQEFSFIIPIDFQQNGEINLI